MGTVTESAGNVVSGASVTLVNSRTSEVRRTVTNSRGSYSLPLLPPASYSLTIENQGFRQFKQENIELNVGDDLTINAALQAGYFILAVRALGLAAGPMTGYDAAGLDAEFFPDGRYKSILVVNIGHPGESAWFNRLPRLDHEAVVSWA